MRSWHGTEFTRVHVSDIVVVRSNSVGKDKVSESSSSMERDKPLAPFELKEGV